MVWVYEVALIDTGEVIKVYSMHCIGSFKNLCVKFGFLYEGWYGYLDENRCPVKA